MKKKGVFILGICLTGLIWSCSNTKKTTDVMQMATFKLGDTTNVGLNDLVLCADDLQLFLEYDSLLSDSRCPVGANCIHQGSAKVSLALSYDKELENITLNTDKKDGNTGSAFGYTVELIAVKPYPGSPQADTTPKSIAIKVTKTN